MAKKKLAPPADEEPVKAIQHRDERVNIPTAEQGPMISEDSVAVHRYRRERYERRDPALDPQLVWKTKDEQNDQDLEVQTVPLYVQEKIQPQAIIDDLRRQAKGEKPSQRTIFDVFEPVEAGKRLEFYQHPQQWSNRLILGDSLLVMNSLADKERLKGKVQTIFMDPPYGIKFGSNWQVSTRRRDVKDAKLDDLTRQPEQIKAFRDTWELGIHSYLSVLRDRLTVARELLTESGSVFVQIGDENVHLVRCLMDEVFGSKNQVSMITFTKTSGAGSFAGGTNVLAAVCDYILWFAKNLDCVKYRQLYTDKESGAAGATKYKTLELPDGTRRAVTAHDMSLGRIPGRLMVDDNLTSQTTRVGQTTVFPVQIGDRSFLPGTGGWKTNAKGMDRLKAAHRLMTTANSLRYVRYMDDFAVFPFTNVWTDIGGVQSRVDPKIYVVQTSATAVQRCLLMTTDPGDLVLDPTCGSGTTAYVAEQWGRRWITIDTSRVALALARTRLMSARYPYYLLADSPQGRRKEAELTGQPPATGDTGDDIRQGFVYKRVPHVTLKSIANNPDIKEGMTRQEIDAAIARHAETETLYDQPYEDKNAVRVCGPFTVESLSPHRVMPGDGTPAPAATPGSFVQTILDNLRKAGVQNTKKGERLKFDRLDLCTQEPFAYEGEYTDEGGTSRRVAVCLGPEFGTVGPGLIQEAARTAHRGLGYDLLLVCGFAFDPHGSEERLFVEKQMGKIKVLLVRMNPDLAMAEDLKKTGAANLFMVFGEPDIVTRHQPDGRYVVELRGLDVFDPTTGELRTSSTDDIACWFLDTDYDGESFFVRHAYFCGGGDPYEKLQRALKAEIDEVEWDKLYSTTSMPFDRPTTGKVAVKVINHYGDEVLKVYPL